MNKNIQTFILHFSSVFHLTKVLISPLYGNWIIHSTWFKTNIRKSFWYKPFESEVIGLNQFQIVKRGGIYILCHLFMASASSISALGIGTQWGNRDEKMHILNHSLQTFGLRSWHEAFWAA